MVRLSEQYQLPFRQTQLDFVDVRSDRDIPVFIDPFALRKEHEPWLADAHEHLQSFFAELLIAIKQGKDSRALNLLEGLHEPHEVRLGYSKTSKGGKGVGPHQSQQLINAISQSQAAQSGLIEDLSESELLIEGFSHDKVSDITTNVLRGHLAEYTATQCETLGLPTENVPLDRIWDIEEKEWTECYVDLPLLDGTPVLLVPKVLVRLAPSVSSKDYYDHYVVEFLRSHKQEAASRLAQTLKKKPKRVTKKETRLEYPFSKKLLYEFSRDHPSILKKYLSESANETRPLSLPDWAEIAEEDTKAAFDGCAELKGTQPGREDADGFHMAVMKCLTVVFEPTLFAPKKEYTLRGDTKRVDITFRNRQDQGFFHLLGTTYKTQCPNIFVECKNYSEDPSNPEVDQLAGRMSRTLGMFGILVCREVKDKAALLKRFKEAHSNQGQWMMFLTIDRICELLELKRLNKEDAIVEMMIHWAEEAIK